MKAGSTRSKVGTRALKAGPLGESRLPGVNEKWPPMVPALVGERKGGGRRIVGNLMKYTLQLWVLKGVVKTGCCR